MEHLLEYAGSVHIYLGPYRGNPISLYLKRTETGCQISPKVYPWNEVVGSGETPNKAAADFEEKWKDEGSLGGYVFRSLVGRRHQAGETCSSQAARCSQTSSTHCCISTCGQPSRRQPLQLLLPTPHRLLLQPWRLSLQTNRANSPYLNGTFRKVALRGGAG